MNILVTGANGQLGQTFQHIEKNPSDIYFFTDVEELDITNLEKVTKYVSDNKINIVINCAAYTDVNKAEENKMTALQINAKGTENLATALADVNGFLIHISTDYVFSGKKRNTPYRESDMACPLNVYGSSKFIGETLLKTSITQYAIIRTSWLYSEFGKNFVKTMLSLFNEKESIDVVNDQMGTPTYTWDLAYAILILIENYKRRRNMHETFHFSNEGECSWFDFANKISELVNNTKCAIKPSKTYSLIERPPYSVLDKSKIKNYLGIEIPSWEESLAKCLEKLR